jgi:hypothetical protein
MKSGHIRRVIAAGMIGNILESMILRSTATSRHKSVVISFPMRMLSPSLLSTVGIFVVGYLMRPLAPSRSRNISGLLACGCGLIYGYYHLIGTNRLPAAQASLLLQHMSEERTNDQDTKRARHENKP